VIKSIKWNSKIMIKIIWESILWTVIKGKRLWNKMWFPTANISLNNKQIDYWVYKVNILIDNIIFHWVWTYLEWKDLFEVHIFNFEEDIYWKNIEIILLTKIRNNKKFNFLEELKENIAEDIKNAKNIEIKVMTFWTFDKLHPWHEYYLNNAKKYSDKLITIVWTDKNVEKIKWKKTKYSQKVRKNNLEKLKISDIILIWDEINPLRSIEKYKPQIICLWYDQIGFIKYLKNYNNKIKIIRLKPFQEKIYKSSLL